MRTVYQEDENGCWIACAAMLSGKEYSELKGRFSFRNGETGRAAGPLVELLLELGVRCERKSTKVTKIKALRFLNFDALVYFKNLDEEGDETSGHWMVWDSSEQAMRDPEGWAGDVGRKIKNFRQVIE